MITDNDVNDICHHEVKNAICYYALKSGMQRMTKSALRCMIKFEIFTNETKLVDIYRKSRISGKDAFFTEEARFHIHRRYGHEIVN